MPIVLSGSSNLSLVADGVLTGITALKSTTANTAPVFQDSNGTPIGTLCRAWVNFNGTGVVAIHAAYNVSTITDNGTGIYTVNFTNPMPDTKYGFTYGMTRENTAFGDVRCNGVSDSLTTTGFKILSGYGAGTAFDFPYISLSFFR